MAEFQGYMCFGGNEVSSWSRVNQNLLDSDAQIDADGCFPSIINDHSCSDDYVDITTDTAPWHDEDVPASYEFMGLYVEEMTGLDGPPYLRSSAVNNAIGGSLSRLKMNGREMAVRGTMYATTCRGMDYGIRWLNQLLVGQSTCSGCVEDELLIRSCCPGDGEDETYGMLIFKRTGLLNPPRYTKPLERCGCLVRVVTWSFFSEIPYMYTKELNTQEIIYDLEEDDCEAQWCNPCPVINDSPCAKDELPSRTLTLSETPPANNWFSTYTYAIGDEVYYGGWLYRAILSTTGNQPDVSPTQWVPVSLVGTWSPVGGWLVDPATVLLDDYYYTVYNTPNLNNECHILIRADQTFTAVNFNLAEGLSTTCKMVIDNTDQYSGCEDPVFDSVFDSLIVTDCACKPPFAIKKLISVNTEPEEVV